MYNHRCFNMHCENTILCINIKLNIIIIKNALDGKDVDLTIELPRQLLKVNNINESTVVSLWELALRKVYTER